jgi:putative ABC transport system permease protein
VLGVLESKGGGAFANNDDVALIPLSTAQARLIRRNPQSRVDMIMVQAGSAETVGRAADEIAQVLRSRHRTEVGLDDFTIFTQQDFINTASTITNVLTIFLGGIAAISLLVGGIGIMNIMLVSVTERT